MNPAGLLRAGLRLGAGVALFTLRARIAGRSWSTRLCPLDGIAIEPCLHTRLGPGVGMRLCSTLRPARTPLAALLGGAMAAARSDALGWPLVGSAITGRAAMLGPVLLGTVLLRAGRLAGSAIQRPHGAHHVGLRFKARRPNRIIALRPTLAGIQNFAADRFLDLTGPSVT